MSHQDLIQGGELHDDMGWDANMREIKAEDLPYSESPSRENHLRKIQKVPPAKVKPAISVQN
jgi:hypothetical protein